MNVFVTGAAGQLGSDLVPRLAAAGMNVAATDIDTLDITDREKVLKEAARARPEVIVNCAAYTRVDQAEREPDKAHAVNRDGAANVAEAAREAGSALIHISTNLVFDGSDPHPYDEDALPNPLSVYGESKLAGEHEVAARSPKHMILRTAWLYGRRGHNFVNTILSYAKERDFLRAVYDQVGTPTWTGDLAGAIVDITKAVGAGRDDWGVYHYADEGVASWYDFAYSIIEESRLLGAPLRCKAVEPIVSSEFSAPARRPAYSVLSKQKIKNTFGLKMPHWSASLKAMLAEVYEGR
jgi:dTDP-4-dehydrorhamnose reductase